MLAQIDSDGIDHVDKNAEDIIDELHRDSGRLDREVVSNIVYDEVDKVRDQIRDQQKKDKDKEHIDDTTNEVLAQIDSDGIDHVDKNAEDIIDELHRDSGRLDREVVSNIVYDEVDKVRDQIRDQNKEQQKANGKS